MEFSVGDLIKYMPSYEEIQSFTSTHAEADYILKMACEKLKEFERTATSWPLEEHRYLVEALVDKTWQRIHTGHFSEVPEDTRKIYAVAAFFKIFFMLMESCSAEQVERCSKILDEAFLLGCTAQLYPASGALQNNLVRLFDELLGNTLAIQLPVLVRQQRQRLACDVPQYDCPSLEAFAKNCCRPQSPALLLNTIEHWPARTKWYDLNYIVKVAGNRTVPIEIGSNYATAEWSQQLVKIKDFLCRQFGGMDAPGAIEYLAQHELFQQIPQLKADIRIPDYCAVENAPAATEDDVDVKAWLGPKGTISPMHYDPKHNLLAQVFGSKSIILASPDDSANLYPHPTQFLNNTAQIDAAHLDLDEFPLAASVKFYRLTLQEGDCLYIPPKWWHYIESLAPSFSVSFWWSTAPSEEQST